ncbi:MAG: phospho-N-acetylmuramoyl-pentapeptide-transferase [Alphaproteobacteria bacterium]|nr:phospho-N-acetylmuramoyl-pentapeptide-transferase [Alphaproteobacteria bacterium]
MLYNLLITKVDILHLFYNPFLRGFCAFISSFLFSMILGEPIIQWLKSKQKQGQPIRNDGPEAHLTKKGTPTMGGILILLTFIFSTFLWANLSHIYIWLTVLIGLGFGFIGFMDDYKKLTKQSSYGIPGKVRLGLEIILSAVIIFLILNEIASETRHTLSLPFIKDFVINLGWFFIPLAIFIVVGSANAVNLTDGLDGLAAGPIIIALISFIIIITTSGIVFTDKILTIETTEKNIELIVLCCALIGSVFGFLWFNAPPAMVFMGDTGSLSLGAILGTLSIITKHELVWAIMGGLFVIETFSVIIQVLYFKRTQRRVFLMAPLHHHFEKRGWPETKVVIRFWVIAFLFASLSLISLVVRL